MVNCTGECWGVGKRLCSEEPGWLRRRMRKIRKRTIIDYCVIFAYFLLVEFAMIYLACYRTFGLARTESNRDLKT